jgi:hypothetical protein
MQPDTLVATASAAKLEHLKILRLILHLSIDDLVHTQLARVLHVVQAQVFEAPKW